MAPVNFSDPMWLHNLLLYLASLWVAWLLAQANGRKP
jgi:hypothetical protein